MTTTQQPYNNNSIWVILLLLAITVVLFSSCYNSQKATDQVNKADSKYPDIVAKLARDKYPCTQLLKTDTAVIFKDTTVFLDCPDSIPKQYETVRFDTVNNVVTRIVKVPVTIHTAGQVITRWWEDSAKITISKIDVNKLRADSSKMTDHIAYLSKKIAHKTKENWIWRIIVALFIIWQLFKIYKRLTTIKVT